MSVYGVAIFPSNYAHTEQGRALAITSEQQDYETLWSQVRKCDEKHPHKHLAFKLVAKCYACISLNSSLGDLFTEFLRI